MIEVTNEERKLDILFMAGLNTVSSLNQLSRTASVLSYSIDNARTANGCTIEQLTRIYEACNKALAELTGMLGETPAITTARTS